MLGTHLNTKQIESLVAKDIKNLSVVNLIDVINNIDHLNPDLIKAALYQAGLKLRQFALPNEYYAVVHEDHTVNEGDYLADRISDFANGRNSLKTLQHFVDRVTITEHRYLQSEIFKLVLNLIEGWSVAYDANHYDERNEYACTMSKYLKQAIDNY